MRRGLKFGYGVYVTSQYSSAAHYSGAKDEWKSHYVYTVEVPAKTADNFISFKQPVSPAIISRAENKLQNLIPEKAKADMLVDAMKFAISLKYEQNEVFRKTLADSEDLYIVEDQSTFRGDTANTWGAKLIDGVYVGPNLMGQLLMELRDNNGRLDYQLPEGALDMIAKL